MNLRTKLIVLFIVLTLVPTVVVGMLVLENIKENVSREKLNNLDTVASLQEAAINNELAHNEELLTAHAERLQTVIELDKYNRDKDLDSKAYLNTVAALAKTEAPRFNGVYILDPDGIVVASTDPEEIGSAWANEDYYKIGKERSDVTQIKMDKDKKLGLYLATPLIFNGTLIGNLSARTNSTWIFLRIVQNNSGPAFGIQQVDTKTVGVLIIKTDLSSIFDAIEITQKFDTNTKTFFFQEDKNGSVIFMSPTSHDEATELLNILNAKTQTVLLSTGYILLNDKNSRLAAVRYIKGTNWGIVVTADKEVVLSEIRQVERSLIAIGIALIFYAIIVATIVAGIVEKEEEQREKHPEKKLAEVFRT